MSQHEVTRARPQRWDEPFGDDMTEALVDRLLGVEPFGSMDPKAFPSATPLRAILLNDTRVIRYADGDLIVREGDYGGSAFLVLDGVARVALENLPEAKADRPSASGGKLRRALARLLSPPKAPETRGPTGLPPVLGPGVGARGDGEHATVFLQDVPAVLDRTRTARLGPGEIFGELSALTRSPRSATVFAESPVVMLEIRWQGLRDLMRYTPALAAHVDMLYRQNSLAVHLRETPLLRGLSAEALERVAEAVEFESFGSFEWQADHPATSELTPFERVEREPIAAEEGQPPGGLLLVRGGFGRVTRREGAGRRTVAYLGKGQQFGAEEIAAAATGEDAAPLRRSLHAVGRLDLIRIPTAVVVEEVLPTLNASQLTAWAASPTAEQPVADSNTLDFLVDHRLMNGTRAMVIDLDRCTRCDDCVRACAATHEGNPRFVRQGAVHDRYQFANACMQCVDPVCLLGCPTGAIHRDEATGVVAINDPTCVGCATCANSCPYKNIQMVEIRDPGGAIQIDEKTNQPIVKATKCDLCAGQLTGPACQHACPHDALVRVDLSDVSGLPSSVTR
ncbi:Electron transport protein HydN [Pseudobythopirellula maris]|uniref:Electron transport protein HydN n=1 Tax=Pseudobythopirellula maris TaxID=2527991 RepID=A0A5C5ZKY9_9BACT|nr:cyclic nucleotide-binding domain-containing protein [Pseudobythopirellula maris]TWT87471.1 Electron transport protein HydN [Pseudobythopirellula maris]